MPVPKPTDSETKEDFMTRCMADPIMQEYDQEQRTAICQRQFEMNEKEFVFAGEVSAVSAWQMVLPIGKFHTAKYGTMEITKQMADDIVKNFQDKVTGERMPFIDTDHDQGAANGWVLSLETREDGVYAQVEWTDVGRENVEQKRYRYFSAMISEHKNIQTGKNYFPVLKAVSLTNTPVMDNMKAVTLSDKSAHGDAQPPTRGKHMDFDTWKKGLDELKLTPEQTLELAEKLGIPKSDPPELPPEEPPTETTKEIKLAAQDKVIAKQAEMIGSLTERVTKLLDRDERKNEDAFIEKMLSEGRITPADETFWRGKYRNDPKTVEAILEKVPKAVDFSTRGSSKDGGEEIVLTAKERQSFKGLLTDEQIDERIEGKKQPEKK